MDFKGTNMEVIEKIGAPGVTRTRGTRIRNPLLYPPELQGHINNLNKLPTGFCPLSFYPHHLKFLSKREGSQPSPLLHSLSIKYYPKFFGVFYPEEFLHRY